MDFISSAIEYVACYGWVMGDLLEEYWASVDEALVGLAEDWIEWFV